MLRKIDKNYVLTSLKIGDMVYYNHWNSTGNPSPNDCHWGIVVDIRRGMPIFEILWVRSCMKAYSRLGLVGNRYSSERASWGSFYYWER
jgi:hypothetical protein